MSKLTSRILFSLILVVVCSAPAFTQTSHSVWSTKPLYVTDWATHAQYKAFVSGNAAFAWTEATPAAYAHALAIVTPVLKYDFMLVTTTSSNADMITGRWNVRRNGVIVCTNCIGKAYILSQPIGNYFKIYVGTAAAYAEHWHYSGYITNRFDF
jgi:hypothetical protein